MFNSDDGTLFSTPANLTVVLNNTPWGSPTRRRRGPEGAIDPAFKTLEVTVAS